MSIFPLNYKKNSNRNEKGQFIKGQKPWNSGTKWLIIGGEKTQFKKGHIPHNTKCDGFISIRRDTSGRKYKYIRVEKNKWLLLQRHIWEKNYGSIPKGSIIIFKDGNTLNCSPSNLKCITRKENLARNRNFQKQAKTMRHAWGTDKLRVKYGLPQLTKLRI